MQRKSMNLTVTDAPHWRRSPNWLHETRKPARRVSSILVCSIRKKLLWAALGFALEDQEEVGSTFCRQSQACLGSHVKREGILLQKEWNKSTYISWEKAIWSLFCCSKRYAWLAIVLEQNEWKCAFTCVVNIRIDFGGQLFFQVYKFWASPLTRQSCWFIFRDLIKHHV